MYASAHTVMLVMLYRNRQLLRSCNGFMATHTYNPRLTPFNRSARILLSLAVLSVSVLYAAESVEFPENFRRWVHVGTGVIMPGGPHPEQEQGCTTSLRIRKPLRGTHPVSLPTAQ
jgi:hypothetical protein